MAMLYGGTHAHVINYNRGGISEWKEATRSGREEMEGHLFGRCASPALTSRPVKGPRVQVPRRTWTVPRCAGFLAGPG